MATTGPCTSSIALQRRLARRHALLDVCSTASTTTMASSTTRPIASTSPNSDSVLIEKPSSGKSANAPTSDTGTVSSGISVARQLWRKMKTTRTTSAIASSERLDDLLDARLHRRGRVERDLVLDAGREALLRSSSIVARMLAATSSALEPGIWNAAMTRGGLAVERAVLLVVERAELDARDVASSAPSSRRGSRAR